MTKIRLMLAAVLITSSAGILGPVSVAAPAAADPPSGAAAVRDAGAASKPTVIAGLPPDGPRSCERLETLRKAAVKAGDDTVSCTRWRDKDDLSAETRRAAKEAVERAGAATALSDDIIGQCGINPGRLIVERDAACRNDVHELSIIDPQTRTLVGFATHQISRFSWSTNGVMRWADSFAITPLTGATQTWGWGLTTSYDLNVSCSGACTVDSADAIGLTPPGVPSSGTWYLKSAALAANTTSQVEALADLVLITPRAKTETERLPFTTVRCDTWKNLANNVDGCVFPAAVPTASWDYSGDVWQVAQHIAEAQDRGLPGKPGTTPLERLTDENLRKANRAKACPDSFPRTPLEDSCDEYPFASTHQGASTGSGAYSAKAVSNTQNGNHGNELNQFLANNRILEKDKYWVQITGRPAPLTIMTMGDSITHGLEGDYTWRYRLVNHLAAKGVRADFVGPHTGTSRIPAELPPGFPNESPAPYFKGEYRDSLTFDSDHFAQWGRMANQAKGDVWGQVGRLQPDYLLVTLGFNDLAWGSTGPTGLVTDMTALVKEAQRVSPGIRILVANVVHRTPLVNAPNLNGDITTYNSRVAGMVSSLNTSQNPVRMVDVDRVYNPATDAYDGLHPNGIGEYKIAKAYADVLASQFSVGSAFGSIPASVPDLTLSRPGWLTARAVDAGIRVTWQHAFGAEGYWLWKRNVTINGLWEKAPLAIPADSWTEGWVATGHTYEFYVVPVRGATLGPASPTDRVTASTETAAGPPGITVTPGSQSLDVFWSPATGPYSNTVTSYRVYYKDEASTLGIADMRQTGATSIRLTGLIPNHSYLIAISSVNASGEGIPSGGIRATPRT